MKYIALLSLLLQYITITVATIHTFDYKCECTKQDPDSKVCLNMECKGSIVEACFSLDTKIIMYSESGSIVKKDIGDINIGDRVFGQVAVSS